LGWVVGLWLTTGFGGHWGACDAVEAGIEPGGCFGEHSDGDEGGAAPEAGGRDRVERGASRQGRPEAGEEVMAEDSNVVAMPGYMAPTPKGEPVPGVVEILRDALACAERGEYVAVAVAAVVDDGQKTALLFSDFTGRPGASSDLYSAIGRMKRRFERWLDGDG
jgi:hypothetical protein